MNSATLPILVALIVQLALGLVVFQANRQLKSNQAFLFLSVIASAWLCAITISIPQSRRVNRSLYKPNARWKSSPSITVTGVASGAVRRSSATVDP